MKFFIGGNYGLIFGDDSFWKNQRRFALHVLRDFGFGKPVLEDTIIDQSNQMTKVLKELDGKPVNMTQILTVGSTKYLKNYYFGLFSDCCRQYYSSIDFWMDSPD